MLHTLFNPKSYTYFLGFTVVICIIFVFLRVFHLPESIGFGSDAGRDYLVIWNLFQNKDITLIGPPTQYVHNGLEFYFGPAPYYIMLPGLLIGKWNVIISSYYLIFLNSLLFIAGLVILNRGLRKDEKPVAYFYAILCTATPAFVDYSRTYWNPYLMLPVSILLVPLLVFMRNHAMTIRKALLFGILFGIGMQFHYSFLFTILICLFLLSINRKISPRSLFYIAIGFAIGFCPLIIFELGNNFHNSRAVLLVIQNFDTRGTTHFPLYYFISLLPFAIMLFSFTLNRIYKLFPIFAILIISFYILISLFYILPVPNNGYGMVDDWNYAALQKTANMIRGDNPQNYNIVDQLTRDNRAQSLRYLLTTQSDNPPEDVYEYGNIDTLYVYSTLPISQLLSNPNYEISAALPLELSETKQITDKIILYKLDKVRPLQ